jgi:hypothetical protein
MRTVYASVEEIRCAWGLVSECPSITVRTMAKRMGTTITRTHYILLFLERTGYIKHNKGMTGRQIVVPFVQI